MFDTIKYNRNNRIVKNIFTGVAVKLKLRKELFIILLTALYMLAGCSSAGNGAGKEAAQEVKVKNLTELKIPEGFEFTPPQELIFSNHDAEVKLFARDFAMGEAVYIEVEPLAGSFSGVKLEINGENVPLTSFHWGLRGFYGINPAAKSGKFKILFAYVNGDSGNSGRVGGTFDVKRTVFPSAQIRIDLGKFSDKDHYSDPENKKHIEESRKLRAEAFKSITTDAVSNGLSHPRDFHKITSEFWKGREYLSYRVKNGKRRQVSSRKSIHRGVDLRGREGEPVFTMADGLVVLSHDMFYEGKMVLIDHGNSIFSYYMHMHERKVQAGDRVKAGDLIGTVGSTGMSTAPHLHVSFVIRGTQVDPLSVLSLPVSN